MRLFLRTLDWAAYFAASAAVSPPALLLRSREAASCPLALLAAAPVVIIYWVWPPEAPTPDAACTGAPPAPSFEDGSAAPEAPAGYPPG